MKTEIYQTVSTTVVDVHVLTYLEYQQATGNDIQDQQDKT